MYKVVPLKSFQKSLQKLRRSGQFNEKLLEVLLVLLVAGAPLPARYEDHQLEGDLQHLRQCHMKGDLILQYKRNRELSLILLDDIGTHHQLLGR